MSDALELNTVLSVSMASIHSRMLAQPGTECTMVRQVLPTLQNWRLGERAGNGNGDGAVQAAMGTRVQEGLTTLGMVTLTGNFPVHPQPHSSHTRPRPL